MSSRCSLIAAGGQPAGQCSGVSADGEVRLDRVIDPGHVATVTSSRLAPAAR